jgi:hypothetical protein
LFEQRRKEKKEVEKYTRCTCRYEEALLFTCYAGSCNTRVSNFSFLNKEKKSCFVEVYEAHAQSNLKNQNPLHHSWKKKALSDFVHRRPSIASHQKAINSPILCEHPDLVGRKNFDLRYHSKVYYLAFAHEVYLEPWVVGCKRDCNRPNLKHVPVE